LKPILLSSDIFRFPPLVNGLACERRRLAEGQMPSVLHAS
jgi:hypothetical protein